MKHKILCTIKSAIYYAGFRGSFLNGKILAGSPATLVDLCSSSFGVVLCRLVTEEPEGRAGWTQIPIGCRVITTVCCDHLVSTPIGRLSSFNSPKSQLQMAQRVRPQRRPGYYNQWTPFSGCTGWCCQSAHCQWAQRKTAPRWQLHLSVWGQEAAATAWITWEQWGGEWHGKFNVYSSTSTNLSCQIERHTVLAHHHLSVNEQALCTAKLKPTDR